MKCLPLGGMSKKVEPKESELSAVPVSVSCVSVSRCVSVSSRCGGEIAAFPWLSRRSLSS